MAPSVGVKLLTSRKISVNFSSRCGPSWPPDLELTSTRKVTLNSDMTPRVTRHDATCHVSRVSQARVSHNHHCTSVQCPRGGLTVIGSQLAIDWHGGDLVSLSENRMNIIVKLVCCRCSVDSYWQYEGFNNGRGVNHVLQNDQSCTELWCVM